MTTNFPGSLDSFTNPSATDAMDSVTVPHASQHANLNDAMEAVQAKLGVGAGTIGAWTSYTPTLTNFTASSIDAQYAEVNSIMFVRVYITVSAVTGIPVFSLPKNYSAQMTSTAVYADVGALSYTGNFLGWSANQVFCSVNNASSTYTYYGFCNTTVPFTWASGDNIQGMLVAKV